MHSFFDVIREGSRYLKVWPKQRALNGLFIDSKVSFYTRLSIKITPAFIALSLGLALTFPISFDPIVSVTFALFLLGLPIQGFYWLGKRSQQLLPQQLLPWFMAIKKKLSAKNAAEKGAIHHPSYLELATLLQQAFKLGGDDFLQHNELI
ncbi:terminus macrodomain insulation protein YfbV [Psychromonas ingrahamii]|uniref:terminus macrodomain insulation protein YfbV n=1 Tax=Psychromonas ingrahamii TaxID=357794 RepID=UPI0002DBC4C3|nr:terminus macrodomain insulation protein YfbV [Psychromonas ingrahamii]